MQHSVRGTSQRKSVSLTHWSVLQVLRVDAVAGVLELGGVDIVDGSPVLDIKPYVPFSDALTTASAPSWVQVN